MTDNPLYPVVCELAEELTRLKGGKLWAKSSSAGPRGLDELHMLLERAGMWAAAWIVEGAIAFIEPEAEEGELDEADDELTDAENALYEIEKVLQERLPIWKMLKQIQHVIHGANPPTPKPPGMADYDDDIPF